MTDSSGLNDEDDNDDNDIDDNRTMTMLIIMISLSPLTQITPRTILIHPGPTTMTMMTMTTTRKTTARSKKTRRKETRRRRRKSARKRKKRKKTTMTMAPTSTTTSMITRVSFRWMDGWMDGRTLKMAPTSMITRVSRLWRWNEWMNEWMNEWVDGLIDGDDVSYEYCEYNYEGRFSWKYSEGMNSGRIELMNEMNGMNELMNYKKEIFEWWRCLRRGFLENGMSERVNECHICPLSCQVVHSISAGSTWLVRA